MAGRPTPRPTASATLLGEFDGEDELKTVRDDDEDELEVAGGRGDTEDVELALLEKL